MNTILTISLTDIFAALLIIGFCVPLVLKKIPMNHIYGIRFKASFKSEENWYEINKYGAKCLMWASVPILAYGIVGAFLHKELEQWYLWVGFVDMILFLGFATVAAFWKAQEIEKLNANKASERNAEIAPLSQHPSS